MPVSSYVIRCAPGNRSAVLDQLNRLSGVEAGEATDRGIPVVTEAATTREAEVLGERLQAIEGVQAAVLVYHNFEDVAPGGPEAPAGAGGRPDSLRCT